ncbi:hypothetical protein C1T17_17925 [Sphingobium sp. SCG-1]|uniref:RNA polymerase sigma factor n=1 Tax=Sphingobium sp. SCG-1 TaxID=2072936 RepID=UPI000CD69562|nr:sigma-70 family RNA polymerase sigma factor [Sphingobium sp. SCG-1]AUW59683.1 hypothetical protein C1T17_17925 [Sphingobium sp. SCG-1]
MAGKESQVKHIVAFDAEAIHRARFVEKLYRSQGSSLVGWLRRRYGAGPPAPEDIAQTAFERIAAVENIEHIRHPKSFLYRTAVNAYLDAVGWMKRTRAFIDDEMYRNGQDQEEMTPEYVFLSKERFGHMAKVIDGLPPKQNEVLMRSRFRSQTFEEIAADTGWSKSDVFRQLQSALITIRSALDRYDACREEGEPSDG